MSHLPVTRRTFVTTATTASLAVAGTLLGTRRLWGQPLSPSVGASCLSAQAFLPEPAAPLDLQRLAMSAIESATRAGAAYADVRVGERHELGLVTNLQNLDQATVRMT